MPAKAEGAADLMVPNDPNHVTAYDPHHTHTEYCLRRYRLNAEAAAEQAATDTHNAHAVIHQLLTNGTCTWDWITKLMHAAHPDAAAQLHAEHQQWLTTHPTPEDRTTDDTTDAINGTRHYEPWYRAPRDTWTPTNLGFTQ